MAITWLLLYGRRTVPDVGLIFNEDSVPPGTDLTGAIEHGKGVNGFLHKMHRVTSCSC